MAATAIPAALFSSPATMRQEDTLHDKFAVSEWHSPSTTLDGQLTAVTAYVHTLTEAPFYSGTPYFSIPNRASQYFRAELIIGSGVPEMVESAADYDHLV